MPWREEDRRYFEAARVSAAASVASAAYATDESDEFSVEDASTLLATINVTAKSGTTPTLDVTLETKVGSGAYYAVGTFSQYNNATGSKSKAFGPLGDTCKWTWTVGGSATPLYTFSISSTFRGEQG